MTEEPHKNDPKRISYSKISCYMQCPLKFKFRYIDEIRRPKSLPQIQGIVIHKAMDFRNKNIIKNNIFRKADEIVNVALAEFDKEIKDNKLEEQSDEVDSGYETIKRLLEGYLTPDELAKRPAIIDSELEKTINLADYSDALKGYTLFGIIDGVISYEPKCIITDYKTTGRSWTYGREHNELQPNVYAMLLKSDWLRCVYDFMINTKKPQYPMLHTDRTEHDINQTLRVIENVVKAVEGGLFYPVKGFLCKPEYCEYCGQECKRW